MSFQTSALLTAAVLSLPVACTKTTTIQPFTVSHVDRRACVSSYPVAIDPSRVGTYSGKVKSGAGLFYDHILEYRVWMHPERGARKLAGDDDYFAAFACYESAMTFSNENAGAES